MNNNYNKGNLNSFLDPENNESNDIVFKNDKDDNFFFDTKIIKNNISNRTFTVTLAAGAPKDNISNNLLYEYEQRNDNIIYYTNKFEYSNNNLEPINVEGDDNYFNINVTKKVQNYCLKKELTDKNTGFYPKYEERETKSYDKRDKTTSKNLQHGEATDSSSVEIGAKTHENFIIDLKKYNEINTKKNCNNNLQNYDEKDGESYDSIYNKDKRTRTKSLEAGGGATVSVLAETAAKNNKNYFKNVKKNKESKHNKNINNNIVSDDEREKESNDLFNKKEKNNRKNLLDFGVTVSVLAETVTKNTENFFIDVRKINEHSNKNNFKNNEITSKTNFNNNLHKYDEKDTESYILFKKNVKTTSKDLFHTNSSAAASVLAETVAENNGNFFKDVKKNKEIYNKNFYCKIEKNNNNQNHSILEHYKKKEYKFTEYSVKKRKINSKTLQYVEDGFIVSVSAKAVDKKIEKMKAKKRNFKNFGNTLKKNFLKKRMLNKKLDVKENIMECEKVYFFGSSRKENGLLTKRVEEANHFDRIGISNLS